MIVAIREGREAMGNGRDAARTVLCVDVGNSDTNLGLFVDGELEAT